MKNLAIFFCIATFLFLNEIIFAQDIPDEIKLNGLYSNSKNIINGTKWIFERKYRGVPFLVEKYWPVGEIRYNGENFKNVQFNYDLFTDNLIIFIKKEGKEKYVKLSNEYLESFSFTDSLTKTKRFFKYFLAEPAKKKKIYEVAYSGNTYDFLIHHDKSVNNKVGGGYLGDYIASVELYIKFGETLEAFNTKKTLLQIFGKHSAELKKYIRSNNLKINRKHYKNIASVVEYFNQLEVNN